MNSNKIQKKIIFFDNSQMSFENLYAETIYKFYGYYKWGEQYDYIKKEKINWEKIYSRKPYLKQHGVPVTFKAENDKRTNLKYISVEWQYEWWIKKNDY